MELYISNDETVLSMNGSPKSISMRKKYHGGYNDCQKTSRKIADYGMSMDDFVQKIKNKNGKKNKRTGQPIIKGCRTTQSLHESQQHPIAPSIGLEHTPWSSSWVHTSAPREFRVVAYLCKDRSGSLPHVSSEQVELGVFEYQVGPSSKHLQVFAVPEEILSTDAAQAANVCMVRLDILSNHGNKDYTCLYRFRVHGRSTWSSDVVS